MRDALEPLHGKRARFTAILDRYGERAHRRGYTERTALLLDVALASTGQIVADHIWLVPTRPFERLGLTGGERVTFSAKVEGYVKGYAGPEWQAYSGAEAIEIDFTLRNPCRVARLNEKDPEDIMSKLTSEEMAEIERRASASKSRNQYRLDVLRLLGHAEALDEEEAGLNEELKARSAALGEIEIACRQMIAQIGPRLGPAAEPIKKMWKLAWAFTRKKSADED